MRTSPDPKRFSPSVQEGDPADSETYVLVTRSRQVAIGGPAYNPDVAPRRRTSRSARDRRRGVLESLISEASGLLQSVANEVTPAVVEAVDVNSVVRHVDIQAIIDRVDVQAVIERVDLNVVLEGVDLNELLDRIDVDRLLSRVDIDEILERADLNRLLGRLDIDSLVDQVDIEKIVGRVDVNAVLAQVDIDALIERTSMGSIIARSSAGLTTKAVEVLRVRGAILDTHLHRWVDHLMRRGGSSELGGPPLLIESQSIAT